MCTSTIYKISTYFFDINSLIINAVLGKPPKISKHHLPLSCKNKRNQPPFNHNKSVELGPSNTKNRSINTKFSHLAICFHT